MQNVSNNENWSERVKGIWDLCVLSALNKTINKIYNK